MRRRNDADAAEPDRRAGAKGLGRRSLDALRVGVLVLDGEDRAVLANPTAKELGQTDFRQDLAAARRFAERIRHESTRLGRLVSELLDLTRLQGGEPLPEPAPVSVDRIVAEVIDRTRTPATVKGLEVGFAGTRGLTVYGSESQLVAAVANLAENAVNYSPDADEGKPAPRVTITARGDVDWVEIAVSDQGIGIEP